MEDIKDVRWSYFVRISDSSGFILFIALISFAQRPSLFFSLFHYTHLHMFFGHFYDTLVIYSVDMIDKTYSDKIDRKCIEILFSLKFQLLISQKSYTLTHLFFLYCSNMKYLKNILFGFPLGDSQDSPLLPGITCNLSYVLFKVV